MVQVQGVCVGVGVGGRMVVASSAIGVGTPSIYSLKVSGVRVRSMGSNGSGEPNKFGHLCT